MKVQKKEQVSYIHVQLHHNILAIAGMVEANLDWSSMWNRSLLYNKGGARYTRVHAHARPLAANICPAATGYARLVPSIGHVCRPNPPLFTVCICNIPPMSVMEEWRLVIN